MIKKEFRLPLNTKIVFKKSFTAGSITVKTAENNLSYNRFGTIVSKKVDKNSTVRNRIKRVISGCVQKEIARLKNGYDILFIVNKKENVINEKIYCSLISSCFDNLKI